MNALDRISEIQSRFGIQTAAAPPPPRKQFDALLSSLKVAGDRTPLSSQAATAPSTIDPLPARFDMYAPIIDHVAAAEGLPSQLVAAVAWTESAFRADAVSSAGARGLMQLMPATAAGLGVDPDDPVQNLRGGARYLRQMLDQFGRVDLALAAYNAGPGAVQKYNGIPPFAETQAYVPKVLERLQVLMGAGA